VHPLAAVQIEYSPWALEIESETTNVLSTCKELGIAIVAYSPLGRGFLTGSIKSADDVKGDWRAMMPRFLPENFSKNLDLVNKITAIADKKGVSSGQLVLAWLLRQWEGVIPIPGTRSIDRVKENVGAMEVVLSDEEDKEIRDACNSAELAGGRYPQMLEYMQIGETPELEVEA